MAETVGLWEIFFVMVLASFLSFGGGSQMPVIQDQWVTPGVLAPELFSFTLAVTYLTPGPKAGYLAGIGYYLAGLPGALVAIAGLVVPTCLGTGAASYATQRMQRLIVSLRTSSAYITGALIAAAAWGAASPMGLGPAEIAAVVVVALVVAWKNIDPVWLFLGAFVVGGVWSWVAAAT